MSAPAEHSLHFCQVKAGLAVLIAGFVCALAVAAQAQNGDGGASTEPISAVPDRPETDRLTPDQQRDMTLLLDVLDDSQIDPVKRVAAGAGLLAKGWPAAVDALRTRLTGATDSGIVLTIARAVSASDRNQPPPALVGPMVRHLGRHDTTVDRALAEALGRYDGDRVVTELIDLVADEQQTVAARRSALLALGEQRKPRAIAALVAFAQPDQPAELRNAALDALQTATGIVRLGRDPEAWRQWWQAHKDLPADRWLNTLVGSLSQSNRQLSSEKRQLVDRLSDAYAQLYLALPEERRAALLKGMLEDDLQELRLLAMAQIERALLNAQPIEETLRAAVRKHLSDANPQVRAKAAALLRDLGDEPAARQVVDRLLRETEPQVQAAFLSLLARAPQGEAIDPALLMLQQEQVRTAAAGFLIAAHGQNLLTDAQRSGVSALSRRLVEDAPLPDPLVVRLLLAVATSQDRLVFEKLLASDSVEVKRAAADAFIEGPFDAGPLIERMDDAQLRAKAVEAAARHGDQLEVAERLLAHRPNNGESLAVWRGAVAAVAGRLSVEELMTLVDVLRDREQVTDALRVQVLAAAVSAGRQEQAELERMRLGLLLDLAELQVKLGQFAAAKPVVTSLAEVLESLPKDIGPRLNALQLATALSEGPTDTALQLLDEWVTPEIDPPQIQRYAQVLADAAERLIGARQTEQAAVLVARGRDILGQDQQSPIAVRLATLQQNLRALQSGQTGADETGDNS